jgi:hypothetical protein
MSLAILTAAAIACGLLFALRRRVAPAAGGLGYVSDSWLAEARASETRES